jgi:MFS family permease
VSRFGTARVAGTGLVVAAISNIVRAFATGETGYPLLLISLIIAGVGVGTAIAPSTASIMSALPPEKAGVGSAINDAARQIGAATGVAVLGSVWASNFHSTIQASATAAGIPSAAVDAGSGSMGGALEAAQHLPGAAQGTLVTLADDAFVHAADVANIVAAVVLLIGAGLAYRYLRRPPGSGVVAVDEVVDAEEEAAEERLEIASALIDVEPGVEGPEGLPTPEILARR